MTYAYERFRPTAFKAWVWLLLIICASGCARTEQIALLATEASTSRDTSPRLVTKLYTRNDNVRKKDLSITQLNVEVTLVPGFAETKVSATFFNPTNEELEGDFSLTLPKDSLVTGYALDIDGYMLPGVLDSKPRAKRTYEARVRQNIDPGLATIDQRNLFTTRVYPIPERGTRRISVEFSTPLHKRQKFELPLKSKSVIKDFKLTVKHQDGNQYPRLEVPIISIKRGIEKTNETTFSATNAELKGVLGIRPAISNSFFVQQHPSGQRFAYLALDNPQPSKSNNKPDSVRIYWDSSLSHANHGRKERKLLQRLVQNLPRTDFELVRFTHSGFNERSLLTTNNFQTELSKFHHGGSGIEKLFSQEQNAEKADLCLIVSDGRMTIGDLPKSTLACPLMVVSAAPNANRRFLSAVAKRNGGRFIDISTLSAKAAMRQLQTPANYPNAVRVDSIDKTTQSHWSTQKSPILVVPIANEAKQLEVDIAGRTKRFNLKEKQRSSATGYSLGAWWASQELVEQQGSNTSQADRLALGRKYSVLTEETSFIVLETIEEYLEADLPLPRLPDGMASEETVKTLKNQYAKKKEERRTNRLSEVLVVWQEQLDWFNAKPRIKKKISTSNAAQADVATPPSARSAHENQIEEVIVTASRKSDTSNANSISITPWSPERPYLTAIDGLCGSDLADRYPSLLAEFGDKPAFFLEMADHAFACTDSEFARESLLSALESEMANTETKVAVAHRLLKFGFLDLAINLFTAVANYEPFRPQPWRNLALAHAERARDKTRSTQQRLDDYQLTVLHLNHIIIEPWFSDFDGIELVALMEANLAIAEMNLLSKPTRPSNPITTQHPLDPRLVALLDVDLRIVVTWNTDVTDLDLWVDEPGGGRVSYSKPHSHLGGRLSNDMTDGYGPEEYLIRNAKPGDYEALVDYYASDQLNPNGPVITEIEIFRDWGRANQSRKVTQREFSNDEDEDDYSLAKIRIR